MNNRAVNTLSYTGIVTLSRYKGNKKIKIAQLHNSGGSSLFNFLADCLIGAFSKNGYPTKIKLLNREPREDETYEYSSVSGFIFKRTLPKKIEDPTGGCRVRYSFMIPRDLLENIPGISTLGLGLYAGSAQENEPENFAAFCALGDDLNLSRAELTNASLLVDWDLVITNKTASISNHLPETDATIVP